MVKSLWDYRSFVWGGVRRDLQLRYFGSVLGIAWLVIQPAGLIAVFFLVFTTVFPNRVIDETVNYGAFLCAGLIPWLMFAEIVQRGHGCFLENAQLIRHSNFPRILLPMTTTLSAMLNFSLLLVIYLAVFAISGQAFSIHIIALPVLIALLGGLAFSLTVFLALINVYARDITQAVPFGLQLLFWLTPVVYSQTAMPEVLARFLAWNPLAAVIDGFQRTIVFHTWPQWHRLLYPLAFLVVSLLLSRLVYRRVSGTLADEL
ncbi:MAG TPA: ABC transporter permease [Casimicrobiaceae bacterium]|nr:ABC transporter permease [Casimicrobiaceae bacterium]